MNRRPVTPHGNRDGRNPNNRNINNTARALNLFRTWGQLEMIGDVSGQWRLYGKFRLIADDGRQPRLAAAKLRQLPGTFSGERRRLGA